MQILTTWDCPLKAPGERYNLASSNWKNACRDVLTMAIENFRI